MECDFTHVTIILMASLLAVTLGTTPVILQTPPNLCHVILVLRIGGLPQFPPEHCIFLLERNPCPEASLTLHSFPSGPWTLSA